ncbi:MAG: hypothetical protein LAN84_01915 [Acidobacteriia bacterium]|nr:hypothetical protein [Terriglobia bacterium]
MGGARRSEARRRRAAGVVTLIAALWAPALFLRAQEPAASAADAAVLRRAGSAAEELIKNLGMVRYIEQVSQYKLRKSGKPEYQQEAFFDSLMLVHVKDGRMSAEESVQKEKPAVRFEQRPLLTTSGFSTLALILHPYYEGSFRFSALGEEVVEGQRLLRLHFEHVKGADSPTVLRLRNRDYPIGLSGTVWLDAQSGAVARISGELAEPLDDIGLHSLSCDVRYASVELQKTPEKLWLPVSASVDLETPRQHWRNVHLFSKYRRYSVDVRVGPGGTP